MTLPRPLRPALALLALWAAHQAPAPAHAAFLTPGDYAATPDPGNVGTAASSVSAGGITVTAASGTFDVLGRSDTVFHVETPAEQGPSEYAVEVTFTNTSGHDINLLAFAFGTGVGDLFVRTADGPGPAAPYDLGPFDGTITSPTSVAYLSADPFGGAGPGELHVGFRLIVGDTSPLGVAGQPYDLTMRVTAVAAEVPEPAGVVLLGIGGVGLAGMVRKRRK